MNFAALAFIVLAACLILGLATMAIFGSKR